MKAPPPKLSVEAFNQAFTDHIAAHYDQGSDGTYRCKKCGTTIKAAACLAVIHDARVPDRCAGDEGCLPISLPYCPQCEGEPTGTDLETCIHV